MLRATCPRQLRDSLRLSRQTSLTRWWLIWGGNNIGAGTKLADGELSAEGGLVPIAST